MYRNPSQYPSSLDSLLADLYTSSKPRVIRNIYSLIEKSTESNWKPEETLEAMSPHTLPLAKSKQISDISSFAQGQDAALRWEALRLLGLLAKCPIGRKGIFYNKGIDGLINRLEYGDDREVDLAASSLALMLNYHTAGHEVDEFSKEIYPAAWSAFVRRTKRSLAMVSLLHSLAHTLSGKFGAKMVSDGILDALLRFNHRAINPSHISELGFKRHAYCQSAHSDRGFFFDLLNRIVMHKENGNAKMVHLGWLEKLATELSLPLSLSHCEAANLLVTLLELPRIESNHLRFAKTRGVHALITRVFPSRRLTGDLYLCVRRSYATVLKEIMYQRCYATALDNFSLTHSRRKYTALEALKYAADQTPGPGTSPKMELDSAHLSLSNNLKTREQKRQQERASARERQAQEKVSKTAVGGGAGARDPSEEGHLSQMVASDLSIGPEIGRGGFSVVHKGFYRERTVAIKRMTVGHVPSESQKMTQKEAAFLKQLDSSYIVRFLGLYFEPQSSVYFLVMEYMAAGSLAHVLATKSERLSWEEKLKFAQDVSKGIAYLHNLRPAVIHGDIKADNVLIRESISSSGKTRVACLSDFGLATVQEKTKTYASQTSSSSSASMAKGAAGTLPFMAPEQLDPDINAVSSRSTDRYSQGVLLWQIAMCKQPWFDIKSPYMIPLLVMSGRRPKIDNARVKPFYRQQIESCWEQNPKHRAEAGDVVQGLSQSS
jgi:hypothetical protein